MGDGVSEKDSLRRGRSRSQSFEGKSRSRSASVEKDFDPLKTELTRDEFVAYVENPRKQPARGISYTEALAAPPEVATPVRGADKARTSTASTTQEAPEPDHHAPPHRRVRRVGRVNATDAARRGSALSYADSIAIFIIVFLNAYIAAASENAANGALEALDALSPPVSVNEMLLTGESEDVSKTDKVKPKKPSAPRSSRRTR
ncbi:calcium-transporting ATPase [Aureococcus anophagefferens]|uniref:Calcium-transporting ATPase n=1 Tax=Aureococcus anophagefferens TaxID=44056 RepID=A0ABR1FL25_AURAN